MCSITNIFGSKYCLNQKCGGGYLEVSQAGQEEQHTYKSVTKCPENISAVGYKYVCLNATNIVNKNN